MSLTWNFHCGKSKTPFIDDLRSSWREIGQIKFSVELSALINRVFSDDEDSSLGATLGLILVAILVCVGIGVGVYFGVAAILNSVKQNRKCRTFLWQIFNYFEILMIAQKLNIC